MTEQEFIAEAKSWHNQLVISFDTIYRVVGAGVSDDYYYICEIPRWQTPGKVIYISAIGFIYPLKGKLAEEDYNRIDNEFRMNGSEGTENFETVYERPDYELPES